VVGRMPGSEVGNPRFLATGRAPIYTCYSQMKTMLSYIIRSAHWCIAHTWLAYLLTSGAMVGFMFPVPSAAFCTP
jgi:hypothetical protein